MKVLKVFSVRSNEHISHEKSVVCASTDNSDSDSVLFVPSCEPIDNVDSVSGVQVINSTFAVDSPDLLQQSLAYDDP